MNDKPLSLMQAGFLPFLLSTITDYATVLHCYEELLERCKSIEAANPSTIL